MKSKPSKTRECPEDTLPITSEGKSLPEMVAAMGVTGSQHTPGPWTNDPLQPTIWSNDGETKIATIADLPWINGKSDWLTEQANARLIAAAPEMFEALKAMLAIHGPVATVSESVKALNQARAILAKIGGKE